MARKSSIRRLPPQLRKELDRLLADGRYTLDQVTAHLQTLGAAVSRSAVGRYSQEFEEVARQLRESRELVAVFARELGPLPDNDLGRFLPEMLHKLIYDVIRPRAGGAGGELEPKELMQLARAIKDSVGSSKISAELALKLKAEAKREAQAEVKAQLSGAAAGGRLDPAVAQEALRVLGF